MLFSQYRADQHTHSVGPGVYEIRIHAHDAYRVFYVAKLEEAVYPPTQKTPGVSPGMNALDGPSVARRAKEGELLRRIPPKKLRIPRA